MTIAIIVPIYNEEPFLHRCLKSIENQTVPFNEVILVDDASTDGSLKIAKEYEKIGGWHVIKNKENKGLSHSRNIGIKKAKSDYVTFLDSDDEILPDTCEKMHRAIEKYPEANFIQFNHLRHYAKINKTVKKYDNRFGWVTAANLQPCQCWWGAWNKVVKKSAIKFYFRDKLARFGEDGIWVLEHILAGEKILCIDEDTVIHHFENLNSLTKSKTLKELNALDEIQREVLAEHCGVDEPLDNIRAIMMCIEDCQSNPNYRQLRGQK